MTTNVAQVSGAWSGVGDATARRLHGLGHVVALLYRVALPYRVARH